MIWRHNRAEERNKYKSWVPAQDGKGSGVGGGEQTFPSQSQQTMRRPILPGSPKGLLRDWAQLPNHEPSCLWLHSEPPQNLAVSNNSRINLLIVSVVWPLLGRMAVSGWSEHWGLHHLESSSFTCSVCLKWVKGQGPLRVSSKGSPCGLLMQLGLPHMAASGWSGFSHGWTLMAQGSKCKWSNK
jgi:hypothetical protein